MHQYNLHKLPPPSTSSQTFSISLLFWFSLLLLICFSFLLLLFRYPQLFVRHRHVHTYPAPLCFLWSLNTQCDFKPERWHSLAHCINSRLCLHGGLSGLVAGGRKGIQLMWQDEGASEREKKKKKKREGEKKQGGCCEKVWEIWVKRTVCGRVVWCEQGWVLGVIIPITCSTVSCSVDGCGLSTHSTLLNPMPFLML